MARAFQPNAFQRSYPGGMGNSIAFQLDDVGSTILLPATSSGATYSRRRWRKLKEERALIALAELEAIQSAIAAEQRSQQLAAMAKAEQMALQRAQAEAAAGTNIFAANQQAALAAQHGINRISDAVRNFQLAAAHAARQAEEDDEEAAMIMHLLRTEQ